MPADSFLPGFWSLSDRRFMYYLSLVGFFAIFSTTISKNPVLPLFSQALGAGDAVIGMIAAVSPLAGILFSFPVGVLSDHIGRRRLLVLSGLVFLSAPLLYLFITTAVWLIPVRFFHGTATAILGPVISAAIAERFPAKKGEMLGQYSSATLIGRTLAPLAGGWILSYLALSHGLIQYQAVYLIAALAAVPVCVLVLWYPKDLAKPLDIPGFSVFYASMRTFFGSSRLRATAMIEMATYFAFGTFETFLPLFLFGKGIGAGGIGIIFAVQVLIIAATKPVFGRLADRIDKRLQILCGILVLGCAVAAIPAGQTFYEFLVISTVLGCGMALSTVATSAYVADLAQRENVGASMGALSATMDIGHAAGPLCSGIIIMQYGYLIGFGASLFLALASAVCFGVSVRSVGE